MDERYLQIVQRYLKLEEKFDVYSGTMYAIRIPMERIRTYLLQIANLREQGEQEFVQSLFKTIETYVNDLDRLYDQFPGA